MGKVKVKAKEKNDNTFIIKIGLDGDGNDRKEKKVDVREKEKVRVKERIIDRTDSDEMLSYSRKDWGGYSPAQLVSKLESAKDAIAKGDAREAIMKLDNCLVRISNRELPRDKESGVYPSYQYQLDKVLPDPGKG
mgnify:FL=1|tara:strand:- start:691 stop:1095 length:405 start_codon:yes stop_codon:yes gene_type:complete